MVYGIYSVAIILIEIICIILDFILQLKDNLVLYYKYWVCWSLISVLWIEPSNSF